MEVKRIPLTKELKLEHWGSGEWVDEPDNFEFEHEGFLCYGIRSACWDGLNHERVAFGHWCAYVKIPKDHPWFDIDIWGKDRPDVEIHGGLTFGEMFEGEFWIGFDCAHSHDIVPSLVQMKKKFREDMKQKYEKLNIDIENSPVFMESYKNISFVMAEVRSLAEQAKKAQYGE